MGASIAQLITENAWPFALALSAVCISFFGFLFREVIRDTLIWRLRTKRERGQRIAEAKRVFNLGEREILMVMARTGERLRLSMDGPVGRGFLAIVGVVRNEIRLDTATLDDVHHLEKTGFLESISISKMTYKLTEKGQEKGEELIALFGDETGQ